ncbi:hypothetical protein ACIOGZ_29560 [Kitasatospora sp. NPDC088160]|uniref:hypothetical protein n=1 Tax=Kitasatospora sp. NPDC088160 TaxID=3364072 RepID=UPI0038195AEE
MPARQCRHGTTRTPSRWCACWPRRGHHDQRHRLAELRRTGRPQDHPGWIPATGGSFPSDLRQLAVTAAWSDTTWHEEHGFVVAGGGDETGYPGPSGLAPAQIAVATVHTPNPRNLP